MKAEWCDAILTLWNIAKAIKQIIKSNESAKYVGYLSTWVREWRTSKVK